MSADVIAFVPGWHVSPLKERIDPMDLAVVDVEGAAIEMRRAVDEAMTANEALTLRGRIAAVAVLVLQVEQYALLRADHLDTRSCR